MEDTAMLVLSRKKDERLVIGDNIVVTVVALNGGRVRLGIQAPAEVRVHRSEVLQAIHGGFDCEMAAGAPATS
jgi:carbon storage regulator